MHDLKIDGKLKKINTNYIDNSQTFFSISSLADFAARGRIIVALNALE
jgi:hypothetical protein